MSTASILAVVASASAESSGDIDAHLAIDGSPLGTLTCSPRQFEQLQVTLLCGDKGADRGGAPALFHITDPARALLDAEAARRERDIFQDGGAL